MNIWEVIERSLIGGQLPDLSPYGTPIVPPSTAGGAWARLMRSAWLQWFGEALLSPRSGLPLPGGAEGEGTPTPPSLESLGLQDLEPMVLAASTLFGSEVPTKAHAKVQLYRSTLGYALDVNRWFIRMVAEETDSATAKILSIMSTPTMAIQGGWRAFAAGSTSTFSSYVGEDGVRYLDMSPIRDSVKQKFAATLKDVLRLARSRGIIGERTMQRLMDIIDHELPSPGEAGTRPIEDQPLSKSRQLEKWAQRYAPYLKLDGGLHQEFVSYGEHLVEQYDLGDEEARWVMNELIPTMQELYNTMAMSAYTQYLVGWSPLYLYFRIPMVPLQIPDSIRTGAGDLHIMFDLRDRLPKQLKEWARHVVESRGWEGKDWVMVTPANMGTIMSEVGMMLLTSRDRIESFVREFTQAQHVEDTSISSAVAVLVLESMQRTLLDWMAEGRRWSTWQELEDDLNATFQAQLDSTLIKARRENWRAVYPTDIYDRLVYAFKPWFKPSSFFLVREGKTILKSAVYKDYRETVEQDIFEEQLGSWLDGYAWSIGQLYMVDPQAALDQTKRLGGQVRHAAVEAWKVIRDMVPSDVNLDDVYERLISFADFWGNKTNPLRGAGGPNNFVRAVQGLFAEIGSMLVEAMGGHRWFGLGVRTTEVGGKSVPVPASGWKRAREFFGKVLEQAAVRFVDALNDPPTSGELAPEARLLGTPAQQLLAHAVAVKVVDPLQDAAIWDYSALSDFIYDRPRIVGEITSRLLQDPDVLAEVQRIANSDPGATTGELIEKIMTWAEENEDLLWSVGMEVMDSWQPDWGKAFIPRIEDSQPFSVWDLPTPIRVRFQELVDQAIEDAGGKDDMAARLASKLVDLYPDMWPDVPVSRRLEYITDVIKTYLDEAISQSAWSLIGRMFADQAVQFRSTQDIEVSIETAPTPEQWLHFDTKRLAGLVFWDLLKILAPVVHFQLGYNPLAAKVRSLISGEELQLGQLTSPTAEAGLIRFNSDRDSLLWLAGSASGWNRQDVEAALPWVKAQAWSLIFSKIPPGLPLAPRILLEQELEAWLDDLIERDVVPFLLAEASWDNSDENLTLACLRAVDYLAADRFQQDWLSTGKLDSYNRLPTEDDVARAEELVEYVPRPYRTHLYVWQWLMDGWKQEIETRTSSDPDWLRGLLENAFRDSKVLTAARAKARVELASSWGQSEPPPDDYLARVYCSRMLEEFQSGGRFKGNIEATIEQTLMDTISYIGWTRQGLPGVSVEAFDRLVQGIINDAVLVWLRGVDHVGILPSLGPSADLDAVALGKAVDAWLREAETWIGDGDEPDLDLLARRLSELSSDVVDHVTPDLGAWSRSQTATSAVSRLVEIALRNATPDSWVTRKVADALSEMRDLLAKYRDQLLQGEPLPPEIADRVSSIVTNSVTMAVAMAASATYAAPVQGIPDPELQYAKLPGGWWKRPGVLVAAEATSKGAVESQPPEPSPNEIQIEVFKGRAKALIDPSRSSLGEALAYELASRWDEEHDTWPVSLRDSLDAYDATASNLATYLEQKFESFISYIKLPELVPEGEGLNQLLRDVVEAFYSIMEPFFTALAKDTLAARFGDEFGFDELRSYVEGMSEEAKSYIWSTDALELLQKIQNGEEVNVQRSEWTPDSLVADKLANVYSSLAGSVFAVVPADRRQEVIDDISSMLDREAEEILKPIAAVFLALDPSGRRAGIVLDNVIKQRLGLDQPVWTTNVIVRGLALESKLGSTCPPELQALNALAGTDDRSLIRALIELGYGAQVLDAAVEEAQGSFASEAELNKWAADLLYKIYQGQDLDEVVDQVSKYLEGSWWVSSVRMGLSSVAQSWERLIGTVYADDVPAGLVPGLEDLISQAIGPVSTQVTPPTPPEEPGETGGELPQQPPIEVVPEARTIFETLRDEVFGPTSASPWVAEKRRWLDSTDPTDLVDQIAQSPEFAANRYGKENFVKFVLERVPNEEVQALLESGDVDAAFQKVLDLNLHRDPRLAEDWRTFAFKSTPMRRRVDVPGLPATDKSLRALIGDYYRTMLWEFSTRLASEGVTELQPSTLQSRFLPALEAEFQQMLAANLNYFVSPAWRRRAIPHWGITVEMAKGDEEIEGPIVTAFDIADPLISKVQGELWVNSLFREGNAIYVVYKQVDDSMLQERIQQILSGFARALWNKFIEENTDEEGHFWITVSDLASAQSELARAVYERGLQLINELMVVPDWSWALERFIETDDPVEKMRIWINATHLWLTGGDEGAAQAKAAIAARMPVDAFLELGLVCDPMYTIYQLNDFAERVWRAQKWYGTDDDWVSDLTREDIERLYFRSGAAAYDPYLAQGNPDAEAKVQRAREMLSSILAGTGASISPGQPHLMDVLDLLIYVYHSGASIPVEVTQTVGLSKAYQDLFHEAMKRDSEYWKRYLYTWIPAQRKAHQLARIRWDLSRGRIETNRLYFDWLDDHLVDSQGISHSREEAERIWNEFCRPAIQSNDPKAMTFAFWQYVKPFAEQMTAAGHVGYENIWSLRYEAYLEAFRQLARSGAIQLGRGGLPPKPESNPLAMAPTSLFIGPPKPVVPHTLREQETGGPWWVPGGMTLTQDITGPTLGLPDLAPETKGIWSTDEEGE